MCFVIKNVGIGTETVMNYANFMPAHLVQVT